MNWRRRAVISFAVGVCMSFGFSFAGVGRIVWLGWILQFPGWIVAASQWGAHAWGTEAMVVFLAGNAVAYGLIVFAFWSVWAWFRRSATSRNPQRGG